MIPASSKTDSVTPVFMIMVLTGLLIACGGRRVGPVTASASEGYCPVCKMKVKASDKWATEIFYRDGTKLMFESPGDMLAFYSSPESYDVPGSHKEKANIERLEVRDYGTGDPININQASLAYKSKVKSPMGPDLIPFANRSDALRFIEEHGGTLISFGDVTPEIVRNLRK